jgi:predicted metal-dependent HD superfamily phosphohydrolase
MTSHDRLQTVWTAIGATTPAPTAALLAAWSAPERHYHDLSHLRSMLDGLDTYRHLADDANAVALAVWFHDAVQDPQRTDDEERSAAWAYKALTEAGCSDLAGRVQEMILATKTHAPSNDPDTALLLDLDLAILGQPRPIYERYVRGVRAEYSDVSDEQWRVGRHAVLTQLLAKPLYNTALFRAAFSEQAQLNLKDERAALQTLL